MERLLRDLSALQDRLWLVADDLHELHPSDARLAILCVRGRIELGLGRDQDALGAFHAAERFAGYLNALHPLVTRGRRAGLADLDEHTRDHAGARVAAATLRLA